MIASAGVKPERAVRRSAPRWDATGVVLSSLVLVVGLGMWELLSRVGVFHPIILPPPSAIASAVSELFLTDYFWPHFYVTIYEAIVGFMIGAPCAVLLGIVLSNWETARKALYPYIVAFQVTPRVALAPLFTIWFGFGVTSKVVMAMVIGFFPTLINTMVGLASVEENARLYLHSLVPTRWQVFSKLSFPTALPYIFAGLKTTLTFCFIGAIVGEFLIAQRGLGLLLETYNFQMLIPRVYAIILILSSTGLLFYLAMEYADRKIVFWRDSWKGEGG